MANITITRRKIGQLISAGVPLSFLGSIAVAKNESYSGTNIQHAIVQLFSERARARRVGLRYLQRFPETHTAQELTENVLQGWTADQRRRAESNYLYFRQQIIIQQKEDFLQGNTCHFEGWILSKTELQLCAIVALS